MIVSFSFYNHHGLQLLHHFSCIHFTMNGANIRKFFLTCKFFCRKCFFILYEIFQLAFIHLRDSSRSFPPIVFDMSKKMSNFAARKNVAIYYLRNHDEQNLCFCIDLHDPPFVLFVQPERPYYTEWYFNRRQPRLP